MKNKYLYYSIVLLMIVLTCGFMIFSIGSASASFVNMTPYYIYDEDFSFTQTVYNTTTVPPCNSGIGTSAFNNYPSSASYIGSYTSSSYLSLNSPGSSSNYYFSIHDSGPIPSVTCYGYFNDANYLSSFFGNVGLSKIAFYFSNRVPLDVLNAGFSNEIYTDVMNYLGDVPFAFAYVNSGFGYSSMYILYVPSSYITEGYTKSTPIGNETITQHLTVACNPSLQYKNYAVNVVRNGNSSSIVVGSYIMGNDDPLAGGIEYTDPYGDLQTTWSDDSSLDFLVGCPIYYNEGLNWGYNYRINITVGNDSHVYEWNELTAPLRYSPLTPTPTPTRTSVFGNNNPLQSYTPRPSVTSPGSFTNQPSIPLPTSTALPGVISPDISAGLIDNIRNITDFRLPDNLSSFFGVPNLEDTKSGMLTNSSSVFYAMKVFALGVVDDIFSNISNFFVPINEFLMLPVSTLYNLLYDFFSYFETYLIYIEGFLLPFSVFAPVVVKFIPAPIVNIAFAFFLFDLAFIFFMYFLPSMIDLGSSTGRVTIDSFKFGRKDSNNNKVKKGGKK